ncbi:MAG: ABC transporter permease [Magnetospirillum sp.]|nr:ABC transporter permease [Magnetospirillum sp.]
MWGRVFALIVKEILAVWRDVKSRFVLIVPPLIQLAVFPYAATYDVNHVTIAVLNEDTGLAARELIARFEGAPAFSGVRLVADETAMTAAIDSREAVVALRVPQDFSRRIAAGQPAQVQVILDGRRSNTAQIVLGYTSGIVAGYGQEITAARGLPPPAGELVTRVWFNPDLDSLWVMVPGLVGVLTQVIALVVTALSVARERELGTFEQLLVTPLRPWEIVVGKTVPALLIGLVEGSIIVVASQVWFKVPLTGSVVLLYGALLAFLLSVIGVGLFISALSHTQQQAILGAFFFVVPAITLSGFATPVANMPDWLQVATLANPIRHILVVLQGVFLKDLPAALVWQSVWPMLVIAAATLPGAAWLFRRRLY